MLFLVMAGVIGVVCWMRAGEFEAAKRRYHRRRKGISMESIRQRLAGTDPDLESAAQSDPVSYLQRLEEG